MTRRKMSPSVCTEEDKKEIDPAVTWEEGGLLLSFLCFYTEKDQLAAPVQTSQR